jgi:undecaprenyl pyrophosphate phosphatase UppP
MSHLTYVQAVVTGIVQGVTELFPISSLGHNVLIPALIGGSWAKDLSVTAKNSPYLAFIVGLHVATALAMIIYFRRDWMRIIRGFFSSLRARRVSTADERLAWMIVAATIPVGIAGLLLQKLFTTVFAKPTLTAFFLAVNGLVLLFAERQRRQRAEAPAGPGDWDSGSARGYDAPGGYGAPGQYGDQRGAPGGGYGPQPGGSGAPGGYGPPGGGAPGGYGAPGGGYGQGGYSQQPREQQWQGPRGQDPEYDPRYGQQPGQRPQQPRFEPNPGQGQQQYGQRPGQGGPGQGAPGQAPPAGPSFTPNPGYQPQPDPRRGQNPGYGQDPRRDPRYGQDPGRGQDTGYGRDAAYGQDAGYDRDGGYMPGPGGDATAVYDPRMGGAGRRDAGHQEESSAAVEADERLSSMSIGRAVLIGAAQILALLPGISRDGIVTVTGMSRGLSREDAVRFSFLLSAPVILLAGLLKVKDLFGPLGKGIHGPVLLGSILAFIGAYISVRFLTKYFSESKSLKPFGIYCIIAGVLSLIYLTLH